MRRRSGLSGGLVPAFLVWLAASATGAEPEAAHLSIGVAPFERVAPPEASVPDVATLLADRLGTRGVERVIGPAQLGAEAAAEPTPEAVTGWASRAGVAAVVVGRTTRIGSQYSVDVRLRSGASGDVVGTYVAEIFRPDDVASAIDRLAAQVVDGTRALVGAAAPAPSRPEPPRAGGGEAGRRDAEAPFGLKGFDREQPISIHADRLEAFQTQGARRLEFSDNVRVEQGDVRITCNRLQAFYPAGASQPDRLVASGSVRVAQGEREAFCDEAVYRRSQDTLVCSGHAELREGEDRVRGERIEFDLAAESVVVKGGASVLIHPREDSLERRRGTEG